MKKGLLLSGLLSISLSAWAQSDCFKVGELYYSVLSEEDRTVCVVNGPDKDFLPADDSKMKRINAYSGDIVVPETIEYDGETYTVTALADKAFYSCFNMDSITLPETLTSVGAEAFFGCTKIKEITFPNSVTEIGDGVMVQCISLKKVHWTSSVSKIPDQAFNSTNLYPEPTPTLDNELEFENIDHVDRIGAGAFGIANIPEYPNWQALKEIGRDAFNGSTIESMIWPEGCVLGENVFSNSYLRSVDLPSDCPDNVSQYFKGANYIERIRIAAVVPPVLSQDWAAEVAKGCVLEVPEESIELYRSAEYWKNFSEIRSSGVEVVAPVNFSAVGCKGMLRVNSADEVKVFDLKGVLQFNGTNFEIALPAGVYIVKSSHSECKVQVM